MQQARIHAASTRTIFLSSIVCVLAILAGCDARHAKENIEANVQALANDETEWLKGKSLCSADSIIGKPEGEKRKELKYAPTPMLLILDDSCRIEDAFLFNTSGGKEKLLEAFIEKCIS